MLNPYRVAIIGAGTSGLAAAVKLCTYDSPRPFDITLYESRREAGGRTRSFIDSESGDTLDNGQHLLMGCYTSTLEYLHTINSEHLLDWQNSLEILFAIPLEHRTATLGMSSGVPVPVNLLLGIISTDLLHAHEKIAAIRMGIGIMLFQFEKRSAGKSCADLFRQANQPLTLIEKLWEPIVVATMNMPIGIASAEVFLHTMRTVFFQKRSYSSLLFPKVGLSDLLITPALRYLEENGCTIMYGQRLQSIIEGNGNVFVEANDRREVYHSVIFAGSYQDVNFLPETILNELPLVEYSPIVNAYLWLDKKVIQKPILGFIGTNVQWCFSKPTNTPGELISCTVSAATNLIEKSNEDITEILWNEIVSAFPHSTAKVLRSVIIKERRATPLLDAQFQSTRPHTISSIPNIYLAGDAVQNGLPMTIEGAVRNGQKAAEAIWKHLR
ncbi:MAG: hydroxysqualene dehydroxylase HpnE [bacterium]